MTITLPRDFNSTGDFEIDYIEEQIIKALEDTPEEC